MLLVRIFRGYIHRHTYRIWKYLIKVLIILFLHKICLRMLQGPPSETQVDTVTYISSSLPCVLFITKGSPVSSLRGNIRYRQHLLNTFISSKSPEFISSELNKCNLASFSWYPYHLITLTLYIEASTIFLFLWLSFLLKKKNKDRKRQ